MAELIEKEAFIEDLKAEISNLRMNGLKGTPRATSDLYGMIDRINEQPTTTEAEIRAKAIDEFIEKLLESNNFFWKPTGYEHGEVVAETRAYKIADIKKIAEQLKSSGNSEQLNGLFETNKWIPVEERLPEKGGEYLTCDEHGNIHIFRYCVDSKYPFAIGPEHQRFYQPIAWQKLPEPYQKGE